MAPHTFGVCFVCALKKMFLLLAMEMANRLAQTEPTYCIEKHRSRSYTFTGR